MPKANTASRQKAKILMLVMSITTTLSGWAIISVKHPPVLAAAPAQPAAIPPQSQPRDSLSPLRPTPIAITRSSR